MPHNRLAEGAGLGCGIGASNIKTPIRPKAIKLPRPSNPPSGTKVRHNGKIIIA